MAIRGKRMTRTNKTIKLLRPRPTTFGCTPKKPIRLYIPGGLGWSLDGYIARFSELNNLRPSEFLINGQIITA